MNTIKLGSDYRQCVRSLVVVNKEIGPGVYTVISTHGITVVLIREPALRRFKPREKRARVRDMRSLNKRFLTIVRIHKS